MEVEKFYETKFESFDSKKTFAQRIFNTFMENGLPMQININTKIIEEARQELQSSQTQNLDNTFSSAFEDIYSMLINVYSDFEKTELFNQMISDLTTSAESEKFHDNLSIDQSNSSSCSCGSIYPMKAYYSALDSITYTVGCMEKIFDEKIASKRISVSRHHQIRRMIVGYCEKRLKMDFPESSLDLRQSLLTDASSSNNQRASITSNLSGLSNISQSNSVKSFKSKRKDELDMY